MFRPTRIAQMRAIQWLARRHLAMRCGVGLGRFGIGRLHPKAARGLNRAQHHLQQMQCAGGLEAVGMRRDSAHGMKADRAADHPVMPVAAKIDPRVIQLERLVKGDTGKLGGKFADARGLDPDAGGDGLGFIFSLQIARGQVLEHRAVAFEGGTQIGAHALFVKRHQFARLDHHRLALAIAQEQPLLGPLVRTHQQRRVGEPREVIEVDLPGLQQTMDQRQDQQAVGPRRHAEPFIRHRVIARADRVDADHLCAASLQLAKTDLERVAVMVFGHAEQEEKLGMVPIRLAEFPKGAADGVDAARRHVDRTEAAVGGIVGRAEILRPETGQALALVAPGEKRQLFGGGFAQRAQPAFREAHGLFPTDLLERARAARPHPAQRRAQA